MPLSSRRAYRPRLLGVAVLLASAATAPADAGRPTVLLPNLVALRTTAVLVGGPETMTTREGATYFGCHPTEVAYDTPAPRRCLRFETHAANAGRGPLELRYRADEAGTTRRVVQRVYASNGTYADRTAGTYVLHATHAHFHYDDFAVAKLWRSDAKGRRLGRAPVREGRKVGFCLQDVYSYKSAGPATYVPPAACYPVHGVEGGSPTQVSGVSPGWVDLYDVSVPHQYVEISGVPDGYYLLQITIDPDRRLRESSTKDNTSWQRIRLCGDQADLVGQTAHCGR